MYLAGHNIIKAHARAYHTYDDNYRSSQNGTIGITLNTNWKDPVEPSNPDQVSAAVSFRDCKLFLSVRIFQST